MAKRGWGGLEILGRPGTEKVAYRSPLNPGRALILAKNERADIGWELSMLEFLESIGMPTLKTYGEIEYQGRLGFEADLYDTTVKQNSRVVEEQVLRRLATAASLADLEQIRAVLVGKQVAIEDFQLLMGAGGRIVVFDPQLVFMGGALMPPGTPDSTGEAKFWEDTQRRNLQVVDAFKGFVVHVLSAKGGA